MIVVDTITPWVLHQIPQAGADTSHSKQRSCALLRVKGSKVKEESTRKVFAVAQVEMQMQYM